MKRTQLLKTIMTVLSTMLVFISFSTTAAYARESKRGIPLTDNYVSGQAGGTETRSWADLDSAKLKHYVYAVQDGVYSESGIKPPGEHAGAISVFGTVNMERDDALGGPLDNGTCNPIWKAGRCGRPFYKDYPLAWG